MKQKVVVHVDEQGTVAAARDRGNRGASAAPLETVVQIDQPFVYVVRDRATGAVLFLGRDQPIPATLTARRVASGACAPGLR